MITLVWLALIVTSNGYVAVPIPESSEFRTAEECRAFGEKMAPRLADYARGMVRADWRQKVDVIFECSAPGQPT